MVRERRRCTMIQASTASTAAPTMATQAAVMATAMLLSPPPSPPPPVAATTPPAVFRIAPGSGSPVARTWPCSTVEREQRAGAPWR